METSPLAISNIVLSQSEHEPVASDTTPKASFYREVLQPNPVPVLLRVRRFRIVTSAFVFAATVAGVTYILSQGVTLNTIHDPLTIATQTQRNALVQDYNAYVAMVASLGVRPLQVLAVIVLPVWMWCFLTETIMTHATATSTNKTKVVVYLVSIALVWLLSNATHGLNVQLVYSESDTRISNSLGTSSVNSTSLDATPDLTQIVDSILRSAVTMDYRTIRSACSRASPQRISAKIEYGFPSRSWMADMTDSSTMSQLQTSLGGTVPATTAFPMDPHAAQSLAAYAFPLMYTSFLSTEEKVSTTVNTSAMIKHLWPETSTGNLWSNINTTFRDFTSTSTSPRIQWFDLANTNVTIASTNISSTFVFERVTFDIPFKANYLERHLTLLNDQSSSVSYSNSETNTHGSTDYFFDINIKEECGEHACIVSPRSEQATDAPADNGPFMHALAICLDSNGQEDVGTTLQWNTSACTKTSSHSILVFSFAQRVQGESLNRTSDNLVRLKNARKVYSVTVGRLSWPADCTGAVCSELSLPLKKDTAITIKRDALPLQDLYNSEATLVTTLAQEIDQGNRLKGDLILPALFSSSLNATSMQCETERGKLLASVEKQHWYSLHSAHQASTAALFWLFQDGAVSSFTAPSHMSSSSPSSSTTSSSSTATARLVMQVPSLSATLVYIGCAIVLLLTVTVLLFSKRHESRIEKHFTPFHLAQMLVGASSPMVPPASLLQSDLLNLGGDFLGSSAQLRDFDIVSLTLRHRQSPSTLIRVPRVPSITASDSSSTSSFLARV